MEQDKPHNRSPLLGLLCAVFGHDYILIGKTPKGINDFQCVLCRKRAAISDNLAPIRTGIKRIRESLSFLF